jgi:hypothetical protein
MGVPGNAVVVAVRLAIGTGSDDLRGGTPLSLQIHLRNGLTIGTPIAHDGWSNDSLHLCEAPVIGSPTYAELLSIGLHFEGGGGIGGDNWNMNQFDVDVLSNSVFYPVIRLRQDPLLMRFTGKDKDWQTPFPPAFALGPVKVTQSSRQALAPLGPKPNPEPAR